MRPLLAELTRANLLVEFTPGRYTFHDLLRAYATERAHNNDPDDQRYRAIRRVLDHYLQTADTASRTLNPHRDPITPPPSLPGITVENPTDPEHAITWFGAEHHVLLAVISHAARAALDTHAWQLACTLTTYLQRRGHWHDWAEMQRTALAAARRLHDRPAQARAHRSLAHAYTWLGRHDDAHTHYMQAIALDDALGDRTGEAHTRRNLAVLLGRQGRHHEALNQAQQALDLYRAASHPGQAAALNDIGWGHAMLGDYHQALTYCQQALVLHQQLGDQDGQAATWDSLGYAHHHLGHYPQAISAYEHAVDLYRNLGDRYCEADTLIHLGDTYQAAGRSDTARRAWQRALHIFDELDHPDAEQVRTKLHDLNKPTAPAHTATSNPASHDTRPS